MGPYLNRNNWINYGRWVQPTLSGCFWCYWNETKSTKEITSGQTFNNIIFLDGHTLGMKADYAKVKKLVETIYKKKQADSFIHHFENIAKKYEKMHLEILNNRTQDLKTYLLGLFSTYQEIIGIWTLSIFLGDALQEYILKNKIVLSEQEILVKIGQYLKETWLEEQAKEVKELAKKIKKVNYKIKSKQITLKYIKNFPQLFNNISKHVKKFSWYGTHHWMGEPYTISKCLFQIKEELNKSGKKKQVKDKASKNSLLKLLAVLTYWRTHCAEITCKVVYESRPLLKKCAKIRGLNYDRFIYLSSKEILVHLARPKLSLPKSFIKRKKGYGCYIVNRGKEEIVVGKKLQSLLDSLVGSVSKSVSEIKGTIASKGEIITGRVKILISPKDFSSFRKGDILVAPETTPDFVPYMKLASAIITDRGGVTSHAAIVSRELGIPCIIGTKIATQVLKDGDLVEVDADKGVVKILK